MKIRRILSSDVCFFFFNVFSRIFLVFYVVKNEFACFLFDVLFFLSFVDKSYVSIPVQPP